MSDEALHYQAEINTPTEVPDPGAYPVRVAKSYPSATRHHLPWPPGRAAHSLGRLLAELGGITRLQWMTPLDMLPFTGSFEHIPDRDPLAWLVTRRPTPSGGARYSAEWYVIAGPDSGIPVGVHYYDPARHALVQLRTGDHRRWASPRPATTVLVQTSVFWRLAVRYGEMAYRLCCLEAGIQLTQALVVGRDLGARAHLRFHDEELNALLGLDPLVEAVQSVITLDGPLPVDPPGPSMAVLPCTTRLHQAVIRESRRDPHPTPSTALSVDGLRIPLPAVEADPAAGAPLRHATLRGFSGATMSLETLAAILAAYGERPRWDLPADIIDLYCVVPDVTGVPAGAYRYDRETHHLEQVYDGDPRAEMRDAALAALPQQGARTANVWLLPVGRPGMGAEQFGNRWYRMQHAAAGAALHRACLAAAALGVAGRIQNDVLTHVLDKLLGLDGDRRSLLLAQLGTEHPGGRRPEFRLIS